MKKIIPVLFLLALGCKHEPLVVIPPGDTGGGGGGGGNVNPDPCDPDSVYFENTILPIIVSNCAMPECHDAISHEEGLVLDTYAHIMNENIIHAGNPWGSDLVEKITETDSGDVMPPPPYDPLSSDQIDAIVTWIAQGALNNACLGDCDPTAAVTFAAIVLPIIENKCQGCHSGSNPSGNLSLNTYSDISSIALDGSLMHSLHGTNGYTVMPSGTGGLSDCEIGQFQTWVDAGAPEN